VDLFVFLRSDILAIVEPHLLPSDEVNLPHFSVLQRTNCRKTRNSEGALVFKTHDSLGGQISTKPYFNEQGHSLFVKWIVDDTHLVMIHKSPKFSTATFMRHLRLELQMIKGEQKYLFFGDFNINLQGPEGKRLIEMFGEYGLTSKLQLTDISTDGGTLIDGCFSNKEDVKATFYESYYSYHKPICIVWPMK